MSWPKTVAAWAVALFVLGIGTMNFSLAGEKIKWHSIRSAWNLVQKPLQRRSWNLHLQQLAIGKKGQRAVKDQGAWPP